MSVVIVLLGLSMIAQTNSGSAGMVLGLSGKVTLQRGAVEASPRLADLLQTGDRIRVESGNLTLLFCPTSERIVLNAGTTIELQPTNVRVVSGAQPAHERAQCMLPQVALGRESLERVGGIRARGNPPIALFTGGPLATTRPVFEWAPLTASPTYQMTLKNSDDDIVWQEQTTATRLPYPDSKVALPPGLYSWEVRAQADGKVVGEQLANFEVKPSTSLLTQNTADPAIMLIQATALENAGYYSEAAAYFRQLQQSNPADERISHHLAWLYWNAGLITAADQAQGNSK